MYISLPIPHFCVQAHARAAHAEETSSIFSEREAELRFEVDRLRAAKKYLEVRLKTTSLLYITYGFFHEQL